MLQTDNFLFGERLMAGMFAFRILGHCLNSSGPPLLAIICPWMSLFDIKGLEILKHGPEIVFGNLVKLNDAMWIWKISPPFDSDAHYWSKGAQERKYLWIKSSKSWNCVLFFFQVQKNTQRISAAKGGAQEKESPLLLSHWQASTP